MKQFIEKPTHICGGTLDLVITRDLRNECLEINEIQVLKICSTSDHFLIKFQCLLQHERETEKKLIAGRKIKDIDIEQHRSK